MATVDNDLVSGQDSLVSKSASADNDNNIDQIGSSPVTNEKISTKNKWGPVKEPLW